MSVNIQIKLNFVFVSFLEFTNEISEIVGFGNQLHVGMAIKTVDITTYEWAARIAYNNTVNVDHWDDLEDDSLS